MVNFRCWSSFLPSLIFIACFASCSKKERHVTKSYYFWRSDGIRPGESKFIREQRITKLYAKLMDVDWSNVYGAYPVAPANLSDLNYDLNHRDSLHVNVVPVIFITNKTFERIDSADILLLAKRIVRRCLPAYDSVDVQYENRNENSWRPKYTKLDPNEIQFDCDWTTKTAKKYFQFLQAVQTLVNGKQVTISATIRLHQYKYPAKTGVPPVDRGMLMVYNISDLTKYEPANSIFDKAKAKAYFTLKAAYPIPLDIALPAYSWGIVFRNKQFYQIENQLSEDEVKTYTFLKPSASHFYTVTTDTVLNELFLRRGDEIKMESINAEILKEAVILSLKAVNKDSFSVALFELSEKEIKNYNYETVQAVYNAYR